MHYKAVVLAPHFPKLSIVSSRFLPPRLRKVSPVSAAKYSNSATKVSRSKTMMNRLSGPAKLLLVSDLDCTMVDHRDVENASLLRFNALWEAQYRHDSLLVYSTGRSPLAYKKLRGLKPLLTPDVIITSVGTEIAYGESLIPDNEWSQSLNRNWNRDIVMEETVRFPELVPQAESHQRPHKVSYILEDANASAVIEALQACLEGRGLDVKFVYSSGSALDVLPKGADKGQALAYLLEKLKANGKLPMKTLVCGDSGNDIDLYSVPEVYGVMVSNALDELLQWYAKNARNNPNILHATERCASGIIQAIDFFNLGPNLSPRDDKDFQKCKVDINAPSHEVVKFYLFYEKWRLGEIEQSDQCIHNLFSVFDPSCVFVHPSGFEGPVHQYIDTMTKTYGDKRGTEFQVWLDRVSLVQVGQGSWLVKFNKWEAYVKKLLSDNCPVDLQGQCAKRVYVVTRASDLVEQLQGRGPNNMALLGGQRGQHICQSVLNKFCRLLFAQLLQASVK